MIYIPQEQNLIFLEEYVLISSNDLVEIETSIQKMKQYLPASTDNLDSVLSKALATYIDRKWRSNPIYTSVRNNLHAQYLQKEPHYNQKLNSLKDKLNTLKESINDPEITQKYIDTHTEYDEECTKPILDQFASESLYQKFSQRSNSFNH